MCIFLFNFRGNGKIFKIRVYVFIEVLGEFERVSIDVRLKFF